MTLDDKHVFESADAHNSPSVRHDQYKNLTPTTTNHQRRTIPHPSSHRTPPPPLSLPSLLSHPPPPLRALLPRISLPSHSWSHPLCAFTSRPSIMATMLALHQTAWGEATEVFKFGSVPAPGEPSPTQVRVRVAAASLNPVDIKRADGFANKTGAANDTFPVVIGYDVAGTVTAVGSEVTRFRVGDAVFGDIHAHSIATRTAGSVAESVLVDAEVLAKKPDGLSWTDAAALPVALLTALVSFDTVKLSPGEKLLVTAGAGGVGHLGIQLAKSDLFKAGTVATTASPAKTEFVKALGADVVVDYRSSSVEAELSNYDAGMELTGDMEGALKVLAPAAAGRMAAVNTFELDDRWKTILVEPKGVDLERVLPVVMSGQIKPTVKVFSFDEAGVKAAVAEIASGRAMGKVVIAMPEASV